MNSVRNQGQQCILPAPEFEKFQHAQGLGRFFKIVGKPAKMTLKEKIAADREESKQMERVLSKTRKDLVEHITESAQRKANTRISQSKLSFSPLKKEESKIEDEFNLK